MYIFGSVTASSLQRDCQLETYRDMCLGKTALDFNRGFVLTTTHLQGHMLAARFNRGTGTGAFVFTDKGDDYLILGGC
jgi:hypothetical protein